MGAWFSCISLQTALATSVDLRCYLILTHRHDGKIVLHLPEFIPNTDMEEDWELVDLGSSTGENDQQFQILRRLSGIDGDETPSILSMAKLVFLYLLVNIYKEKLK